MRNDKNKGKGKGKPGKVQDTPEQANERALAGLYGTEGANAGNALINKFLQPGALGRVSTDIQGAKGSQDRYASLYQSTLNRAPEQETAMANMKAGLGGYTSPEYQAQREQMQRGLNSNMATSSSALARSQARGKVYGAAASAQQGNLIRGAQDTKDNLEQELMSKNIDERDRRNLQYGEYGRGLNQEEFDRRASATKGYGDEEAALRTEELERQKVNLGQSNAELAAQIGAYTGAGATALAQKNAEAGQDISRQGIRAMSDGGGGGNAGGGRTGTSTSTKAKANERASKNTYDTAGKLVKNKGPGKLQGRR